MSEVLTINVRGLHTDTALAVHGGSLLTSTNQSIAMGNSSRDDWSLSPHRWLCTESTLTVLAYEWATCMVLAVAVLRQPECLIIHRVHVHTISIQTISQLDLR